jgi:hypothetical protein
LGFGLRRGRHGRSLGLIRLTRNLGMEVGIPTEA